MIASNTRQPVTNALQILDAMLLAHKWRLHEQLLLASQPLSNARWRWPKRVSWTRSRARGQKKRMAQVHIAYAEIMAALAQDGRLPATGSNGVGDSGDYGINSSARDGGGKSGAHHFTCNVAFRGIRAQIVDVVDELETDLCRACYCDYCSSLWVWRSRGIRWTT